MVALTEQKKILSPLRFLNLFSEKSFLLGKARYVEFRKNSVPFLFLFPSCVVSLATAVTRHTLDSLFLFFSCVQYFFPLPLLPYSAEQPNLVTLIPSRILGGFPPLFPEFSVSRCISGTLWKGKILVKSNFDTFRKVSPKT